METTCAECGATLADGLACQEHFWQMLAWENEFPGLGEVHNLTVLCYYLQHPSLYSAEGLRGAIDLLQDFLEGGLSPAQVRRREQAKLDSSQRTWKISAAPGNQGASPTNVGAYPRSPAWNLRAPDVTAGGPQEYVERVRAWARSVHQAIQEA